MARRHAVPLDRARGLNTITTLIGAKREGLTDPRSRGGRGRDEDRTSAWVVDVANASPPFSLAHLTFVAYHVATSTADRSVTPMLTLGSKCSTPKPQLQKAFVPQPADKVFDKSVLHWLAWRDVVPLDLALLLPGQDGVGGQLSAIV